MSDWKPGDKAVFIHGHKTKNPGSRYNALNYLTLGQTCTVIHADRHDGVCVSHEELQGAFLCVEECGLDVGFCAACFRRPINFTQLFNVNTTVKETENA